MGVPPPPSTVVLGGRRWPQKANLERDMVSRPRWTPRKTYCGGQCISMDSLHNILRPAMAIHGRVSQSLSMAGNVYRLTASPVYCYHIRLVPPSLQFYCHRQYLSIDTFNRLLYSTMHIDRFFPSSTVETNKSLPTEAIAARASPPPPGHLYGTDPTQIKVYLIYIRLR